MLSVEPLEGLPEVSPGDDLAAQIAGCLPSPLQAGDALVIAHKVVSKAEGRIRRLADVRPTEQAARIAARLDKDPRHVQVVLEESESIIRAERGVLICVTRHGFVCANAGVDASNVPCDDALVLLPEDPDSSARELRARLAELGQAAPAVVISDSFGRAWRQGQVDVAIGCAGLEPLADWRGRRDGAGRELRATWIAVADELAAAADLARTKDGMQPVILVRGSRRPPLGADGPGATALIRPAEEDLFR